MGLLMLLIPFSNNLTTSTGVKRYHCAQSSYRVKEGKMVL